MGQQVALAQLKNAPNSKLNKVEIKADRFLFMDDDVFYIPRDTIIFVADTVDIIIRKHNMEKSDEFYERVQYKMSKKKVSSMAYDFLFTSPSKDKPHNENVSEFRFTAFQDNIIGSIDYKSLATFGTRMNDTAYYNPSKYTKMLNDVHFNSNRWVIRKNLLFKQGERVDPSKIVDSERLLRRLNYIQDARIFITEYASDVVDVQVMTKDVFPYDIQISPGNENDAVFGISHINIGGLGHELEYDYIDVGDYEFFYTVRNIMGSFIDSELDFSNHFRKTGIGGTLRKEFVTADTKFGGGAEYSQFEFGEYSYEPVSDVTTEFFYKKERRDFWVGRAFKTSFKANKIGFDKQTYVVASGRVDYQDFFDKPFVAIDSNYLLHDRTNVLIGLGLSTREYYKDKFILNYGRTEDIPTGTSFDIVGGVQHREFEDRLYAGGNYARGGYLDGFGYLNSIFSLGSFITTEGLKDGVFKIGMDYFSSLIAFDQFKFRQFVNFSYSQTIDPTEDVFIRNQNDLGVRGISGFYLKATNKVNLRIESQFFTPVMFLGFRMAIFAFFDGSFIGNHISKEINQDLYMGYGMGLRFRNENLAISTLQLRFGFYPNVPHNGNANLIDISTSTRLSIRDFDFKAPEIVQF